MSAEEGSAVWWRINSRMETKSIYLYGFRFSPRQLLITFSSLMVGYVFSLAAPGTVDKVPFLGKFVVIGIFVFAGFTISSMRIKMVPVEMVLLYRLTGYRTGTVAASKEAPEAQERKEEEKEMLPIDDFTQPTPYNVSGKLKVQRKTKLSFLLDSKLLGESYVSPSVSQYWFVYTAKPEDIGTHELIVKADGIEKPLFQKTIAVFPRGREMMLEEARSK